MRNKPIAPPPKPQELIFADGASHFDSLIADIHQAQESIDLETYIFSNDVLGKQIIQALANACARGVKVRVLVDGAGSPYWSASLAKSLEKTGGQSKVFHPFPWQLWNWSRSVAKIPLLLKWMYLLFKINFRNHRKICLIDNKIAYVGSFNISKCHLPTEAGGHNWRDTSVRLSQTNLAELGKAFDCAWHHRTIKERMRDTFRQMRQEPIVRLNYSRHRRRILHKHLLRKISHCRERIWITNAYFVPDNFLLRRLIDAAKHSVDVRILLPKKSDVFMMPWASSTFYYNLLKAGVRIFEYKPSVLHAKSLLIDDWGLIGSSNLNHRSLLHDLEVDINLSNHHSVEKLAQLFLADLEQSRELSLTDWHQHRPRLQRIMGRMVLYMKYWI